MHQLSQMSVAPERTTHHHIYIPDFITEYVNDNLSEAEMIAAHDLFLKKDWLSPGLTTEIQSHFPKNEDIRPETGSERCQESCKQHCLELFPTDHKFTSSRQIQHAA
jgi:hypothetical protein